jgi:hypothetical protein
MQVEALVSRLRLSGLEDMAVIVVIIVLVTVSESSKIAYRYWKEASQRR